jgi:hypothetical protein
MPCKNIDLQYIKIVEYKWALREGEKRITGAAASKPPKAVYSI